eukprot:7118849-Pyramimonas_sp.AAC.1
MVVEARTAALPRTIEPAPADHVPHPTTPAKVPQDGSTACCNRERCPGLEVCWWRNPHSIGSVEQWRRRYTNAEVYGAERTRRRCTTRIAQASRFHCWPTSASSTQSYAARQPTDDRSTRASAT